MLLGLYKNEDDVRTYYDVLHSAKYQNFYLVIFSFGETHPSKFALQFKSIWPVLDQEK